jgi:hypothetical protein
MTIVQKIFGASALAALQISATYAAPVVDLPTSQPIPQAIEPRLPEGISLLPKRRSRQR